MVLCVLLTRFKSCLTFAVYAFVCVIYKIEQGVTLNSLLRVVQRNICWLKRQNLTSKLATCNVVLCVFLTRFKPCLTLVVHAFDYVIPKIEQGLTLNSLLRAVQRNICWFKRRNLRSKLETCNMVLCVFQTRFKPCLTLVMEGFCYVVNEIEQVLTLNSLMRVVQAQDTLQIHWSRCTVNCTFCTSLPLKNQLNKGF